MQIKVMVQICFTGDKPSSLIIFNEKGISADEYEDIIYNKLFSLVDDGLELLEEPEII